MSTVHGLSGILLPVHPQPLPDELLTHWFVRLAHANQVKVQTLADKAFGRSSAFWARDQDKLASPAVISRLAELTGKSAEDIRELTLAPFEGVLYQRHNPMGNTRWLLPAGIFHRTRRRFALQFCPLCLATDPEPYFRRQWRLAFATVCERHGVLMHDRCHQCGSPVAFHRGELGRGRKHQFESSILCHVCRCDLSRAPAWDPPAGDVHALVQLRSLATFHGMGWTFCGTENYQYGHLFMDVLHRMCNFLASAKGDSLLEFAVAESRLPVNSLVRVHDFEYRPVRERHFLLLAALWLLMDWPDRLVQACRRVRITQSKLLTDWDPPYWFFSEVWKHLDRSRYVSTEGEARQAAAYLDRTQKKVSRAAVGRLIGNPESISTVSYGRPKPRLMTEDEAARFFARIDEAIRSKSKGSQARLLLERDRAIFWFIRLTRLSEKHARTISVSEAIKLAKAMHVSGPGQSKLLGVVLSYLRDVRPALVKGSDSRILFLAANGSGMCVEALRKRLRKQT